MQPTPSRRRLEPGPSFQPPAAPADMEVDAPVLLQPAVTGTPLLAPPVPVREPPVPPYPHPLLLPGPVAQYFTFFPTSEGYMEVDPTTVPPQGSDQEFSFFSDAVDTLSDGSDMDVTSDPPRTSPNPPLPPAPPPALPPDSLPQIRQPPNPLHGPAASHCPSPAPLPASFSAPPAPPAASTPPTGPI